MVLWLLAYVGGVLTILSPCILPVLPFVFARSDQPFRRTGLPLLAGMAVTFAGVASLATVGGGWVVRANQFGRVAALVVFAIFGLTLLLPSLADRLTRPLVRLGGRLGSSGEAGPGQSFLLGIGTGLLWAPCAGPILGLILTGAALGGASGKTAVLLLAYALGAATSLAVALLAGGKVFAAMKRGLGAEEWIRRALGAAVLLGVVAVAFGLDRGVLTRLSLASTGGLEQRLVDKVGPRKDLPHQDLTINEDAGGNGAMTANGAMMSTAGPGGVSQAPSPLDGLTGATAWINSEPLSADDLKGKVVVVDFWTYSCINCLRSLPYIKAWNERYKAAGLVIVGVHTPEFPFEKDEANVRKAVKDLGVTYPVAMDDDYRVWQAFHNQYWPAHYFIDATGKVRFHHFGEGDYEQSEQWIRQLLQEAGKTVPGGDSQIAATGVEAGSDLSAPKSPETYLGYSRAQNFASPEGLQRDHAAMYRVPESLALNQWALEGRWSDAAQIATADEESDGISFRFHARDLHLVLGPGRDGKPVRFRVTLDGQAPGADHGMDTDAQGFGVVKENRLYQLIRQGSGGIRDRTFRIEFLSPGVQAYSFTFG